MPDELQGLATVHHGKHEVAFAAGEGLGATLGSGLYCRIRAVELGGKKKCDGRISQGHERLVLKDGTTIFYGSFVSSEKNLDCPNSAIIMGDSRRRIPMCLAWGLAFLCRQAQRKKELAAAAGGPEQSAVRRTRPKCAAIQHDHLVEQFLSCIAQ